MKMSKIYYFCDITIFYCDSLKNIPRSKVPWFLIFFIFKLNLTLAGPTSCRDALNVQKFLWHFFEALTRKVEKCHLRDAVFRDRLEEVFLLLNICVQCANFSISSSLISKYLDKLLPPFSCKWECLNLLAVKLPLLPLPLTFPHIYVEIYPCSSKHIFF